MYKQFKKRSKKPLNTIDENATIKVPVSGHSDQSEFGTPFT